MSSEKPEFVARLTKKYSAKIRGHAYRARVPVKDAMSEAMYWEWQIQCKIKNLEHQKAYFLKILPHKIYAINKDYWSTSKVKSNIPNLDILDTIVTMRDFNVLHYEHLIQHIHALLTELDKVAAEMFMIRINDPSRKWHRIQMEDYPNTPHSQFYRRKELIESVSLRESVTHGSAVC